MQLPVRECVCRSLFASLPLSCICLARTLTNSQAVERALSLSLMQPKMQDGRFIHKQSGRPAQQAKTCALLACAAEACTQTIGSEPNASRSYASTKGDVASLPAQLTLPKHALQQALSCSRSWERRATRAEVTRAVCVVVIARQCTKRNLAPLPAQLTLQPKRREASNESRTPAEVTRAAWQAMDDDGHYCPFRAPLRAE